MAKFEVTKNKLKKLWDAQVNNLNNIIKLEQKQAEALKHPANINQTHQHIKLLRNLNQDWTFMDTLVLDEGEWHYKTWNFDMGLIDESWLTHFKVEILHRLGNGEGDDSINLPDPAFFKKQTFFDIKDRAEAPNSSLKYVKFCASIFIEKPNIFASIPPYQVKLLGEIHNLSDFD